MSLPCIAYVCDKGSFMFGSTCYGVLDCDNKATDNYDRIIQSLIMCRNILCSTSDENGPKIYIFSYMLLFSMADGRVTLGSQKYLL